MWIPYYSKCVFKLRFNHIAVNDKRESIILKLIYSAKSCAIRSSENLTFDSRIQRQWNEINYLRNIVRVCGKYPMGRRQVGQFNCQLSNWRMQRPGRLCEQIVFQSFHVNCIQHKMCAVQLLLFDWQVLILSSII